MHTNLFEKISKNNKNTKETQENNQEDSRVIETIKLLGKQILEIREIIEDQADTITALKKEIQVLRTRQNDTDANLNLSHIDQKDVVKQLRILRANVEGSQIASQRVPQAQQVSIPIAQLKTQEDIRANYFPNYQNSQVVQNSQTLEMIDQAMTRSQEPPVEEIPIKRAEDIAKQFIFGRMPKLLNLD